MLFFQIKLGYFLWSNGYIKYRSKESVSEDDVSLGIIIGVVVTVAIILAMIIVFIVIRRRRRSKDAMPMRPTNGTLIERVDRPQNVYGLVRASILGIQQHCR